MIHILNRIKIYYEYLNEKMQIVPENQSFWNYLKLPFPGEPVAADEIFPELFGSEEQIKAVMKGEQPDFQLPGIGRDNTYFNISIFSEPQESGEKSENQTILIISDVSKEMENQRIIIQDKNEISFLKRKLEGQNSELLSLNKELDDLMKTIRTQNHDLNFEVKRRTRDLHESRLSVITTLAIAAETKDMSTGGHIYRIGRSSVLIGQQYGLDPHETEKLFYASLLHDVGKIGIPDAILLKPALLTDEERRIMESHTTIGSAILRRTSGSFFEGIADVALHHHERWDGKGYPHGLSGEKIPLWSRICAVADVFDALVTERNYKKQWDYDKAFEFMKTESGKHFDPEVVNAFIKVQDEIKHVHEISSEEVEEFLLPEI